MANLIQFSDKFMTVKDLSSTRNLFEFFNLALAKTIGTSEKEIDLNFANGEIINVVEDRWTENSYQINVEIMSAERLKNHIRLFNIVWTDNEEFDVCFCIGNIFIKAKQIPDSYKINFEFEENQYLAPISITITGKNNFQLPDGRILKVKTWSKDEPPKILDVIVLDQTQAKLISTD
jgi:hypothetical protein